MDTSSGWGVVALLVIVLFFFGNPFALVTPDATIEVEEGSTVDLPYVYNYDTSDWFGNNVDIYLVIDYYGYHADDETLGHFSTNNGDGTYQGTVSWEVLGETGDEYQLEMEAKIDKGSGSMVRDGSCTVSVTVVEEGSGEDIGDLVIVDDDSFFDWFWSFIDSIFDWFRSWFSAS